MADVTQEVVEPRKAALIAQLLHRLRDAADADRRRAGIAIRRAARPRVFGGERRVQAQLLLQLAVGPSRPQRGLEAGDPFAQRGHGARPGAIRGRSGARG